MGVKLSKTQQKMLDLVGHWEKYCIWKEPWPTDGRKVHGKWRTLHSLEDGPHRGRVPPSGMDCQTHRQRKGAMAATAKVKLTGVATVTFTRIIEMPVDELEEFVQRCTDDDENIDVNLDPEYRGTRMSFDTWDDLGFEVLKE